MAEVSAANCGLPFEDLHIPVAHTGRVHAWRIPAAMQSEKAVLVLQGNGYVLEGMICEEVSALHEIGANVPIIDGRGYGFSTSISPDELSIVEDERAALEYLVRERNIAVRNLFMLGRSIGSGPAPELAYETKALRGLILESPFSSIEAAAPATFWFSRLYSLRLLLRTDFDNLSKIGSIRTPLLVVAGTADALTPVPMARATFAMHVRRKNCTWSNRRITMT
ncbi:MAG: alpha/beta hydrolase [Acidobacteriota bacterium]|nr:alpha/beta hydrolase [Acidobacteriota bacterium]